MDTPLKLPVQELDRLKASAQASAQAFSSNFFGSLLLAVPLLLFWYFTRDNTSPATMKFNVEVSPSAKETESGVRRCYRAKDGLWTFPQGMDEATGNVIYNFFKTKAAKQANRNCMASRKVVAVHNEMRDVQKMVDGEMTTIKKPWVVQELSGYTYQTYQEVAEIVDHLGAGILHLGVKPSGVERFHIFAATSAQWLQGALALCGNGIPVVTAYDTLGESGLIHSIKECESVGMLLDNSLLKTIAGPLNKGVNSIRLLITTGDHKDEDEEHINNLKTSCPDIKVYSFNEVVELGKKNPAKMHVPKTEDIAVIMYTSGSTGPPKGVILTNQNVMAGVSGVTGVIEKDVLVGKNDRVLAMLPLAHILEFTMELCCFQWGAVLGYGNPRTMSDANVKNCKGDVREFTPTVMVGVPMVWEAVRKGVLQKVKALPSLSQKIFWSAYHAKTGLAKWKIPLPLVDSLIFKKVRDATGGKLRFCFNGGAAVSADTQIFITNLIAPMLIGYGLTETNANTSLMIPECFEYGIQGEFTCAVEGKLVDVADAGYFGKKGQGELWLRGPAISPGYFKNDKETKEAYEDGWFKTGDVAEWTHNGCIKLIDRKKNLVKTLHGEYIALEKLESVYRSSSFVANICVYADADHAKPIAIIVPNEPAVKSYCKENNLEFHEDVSHDEAVKKVIYDSMIETGKRHGFKGIDLIESVVISPIEWTPQNGFLSSAQKLQRKVIIDDNKEAIQKAFSD